MLAKQKLKHLSEFARFVDARPDVANMIMKSSQLNDVQQLAARLGFKEVTVELLEDAKSLLAHSRWMMKAEGRNWTDHVFVMTLALILDARKKR